MVKAMEEMSSVMQSSPADWASKQKVPVTKHSHSAGSGTRPKANGLAGWGRQLGVQITESQRRNNNRNGRR